MRTALQASYLAFAVTVLTGCALGGRSVAPPFPEFPWPPPRASTHANLAPEMFRKPQRGVVLLRDVDRRLSAALSAAGYDEKSYHSVPDGFALAARLEQINPDGTPKVGAGRWAVDVPALQEFSLSSYLNALLTSQPGLFRVIVFIVTPHPFPQSDVPVSRQDAMDWVHSGFNRLPESIGTRPYTEHYRCTALIYEFEKKQGQSDANIVWPGRLIARSHLERAAIMRGLKD